MLPPATINIPKATEPLRAPVPTSECVNCIRLGLTEGRHKVEGGWCIDGVFWPTSAIGIMRHIKLLKGEEEAIKISKALTILTKTLDLDLDKLKASYVR